MKHNALAHLLLAGILFTINVVIFNGAGTWTALLGTSAQVTGTMLVAQEDIGAAAAHMEQLIPLAATILVNLILYYIAAGIIIALYALITHDRSVA